MSLILPRRNRARAGGLGRLWFSPEALLLEVPIEGEGGCYIPFSHDDERDAICQRVAFVRASLEVVEASMEQLSVHVHDLYRRASKQPASDLHRRGVQPARVEVCDHLIEDIRGRDKARQPFILARSPVYERLFVVLVRTQFESKKVAGVYKDPAHATLNAVEIAVVVDRSIRHLVVYRVLAKREDRVLPL
jgi:hypothetical protein